LAAKAKLDNFEKDGDIYKVKTFKEITKLERNGLFVYESVPGTAVMDFEETADTVTFTVEGPEDAQITLGLEEETEYEIDIAGAVAGTMKTNLGGKLSLSVELEGVDSVDIKVEHIFSPVKAGLFVFYKGEQYGKRKDLCIFLPGMWL